MAEMHKHTEPFFILGRCSFQVNGQQAQTARHWTQATVIVRDYILTNTAYSSLQSITTQTILADNGEAGSGTTVQTLMGQIPNVIQNGLTALPNLTDPKIWLSLSNRSQQCKYT